MIYSRIYQQNPHSKHTKEQILHLHYTIFSIECDFKYHLPITIAQLALFIAYLQNKSFAARTISTYVSALDFIHKINKLPDPTEALLIEKTYSISPQTKEIRQQTSNHKFNYKPTCECS